MKAVGLIVFVLLLIDPGKIGRINSLKSEARAAFEAGDFPTAIAKYKYLIDSLGVTEDEIRMNLAHAYFKASDTLKAFDSYMPLAQSSDSHIRSIANQQLGVLANRQGKMTDALQYFKQALKAAPGNDDARFNYELVKKKLSQQKDQNTEQSDNGKPQEPSEFAKQLKAKADQLVRQHQYAEAYQLMVDGFKKDKSVAYYQEFTKRTNEVAGIK